MNYYDEIKNILISNEAYKQVKDYYKNRNDLMSYYNVGKLLIDAQGGEKRAKYGDNLIKEYSIKLTKELGRKYNQTLLKNIRRYYIVKNICPTMSDKLSWSHYIELIWINNINKINYYIGVASSQNLSVRELRRRIRLNEYERLSDEAKSKIFNKENISIKDNLLNPKKGIVFVFTFIIPYAFINYYPLLYFLDKKNNILYMFSPLLVFIFLIPCLLSFKIGLKHYSSTGS